MELILTSYALGIGTIVCLIISLFVLHKMACCKREDILIPGIATLTIIAVMVCVFIIEPVSRQESHDFYEDNIHDLVIHATENTTDINEKAIQIRSICALFTEIPQSKCLEYAREDMIGAGR